MNGNDAKEQAANAAHVHAVEQAAAQALVEEKESESCINTIIMSILYRADPEDVKLIMIDPKVVELSVYNGIPPLSGMYLLIKSTE